MDRDGHPRSHEEDPLQQVEPTGIDRDDQPVRPGGDVLSDGWTPGHEPAHAPDDEASDPDRADHQWAEGDERLESLEEFDYLYRREGEEMVLDDERSESEDPERPGREEWDTESGGERGFLGSGWTGEADAEEKGGKNKGFIVAIAAIVLLAVAGGWIVSTSVGSKPEAACSAPGKCPSVEQSDPALTDTPSAGPSIGDPATEPTAGTGETAEPPSGTPTPTAGQGRQTRPPTSRPTPTRTRVHSPRPSPRSSGRPQQTQDPRIEDDPESSPKPPPTTQAPPPPAPSPTQSESGGGLLDWIF
ncbi:hypothetical protein ABZU32_04440 [Sphaerisporangium sp. NPDC005288]|uniref:hypothetical protein n=1 Tax=Sphaerisporangium sp. NPDC005288 TaxID=3155114 RepID=UPI0033A35D40